MGLPRAVYLYSLLSWPPRDPRLGPRDIFDMSNFPRWVSTPFLPYCRSKRTGAIAHMGQAAPTSRCEPTFRSSETPALLRP